jgi:hypothetical protein
MTEELIPAGELFPKAFGSSTPSWMYSTKDLPDDEDQKFYICSSWFQAWRYFTTEKQVRIFKEEPSPSVYEHEIGLKYQSTEKDKPQSYLFCRAWSVERAEMVCLVVDSAAAGKQIAEEYSSNKNLFYIRRNPDNAQAIVSNHYVTLRKNPKSPPAGRYTARVDLRATENPAVYAAASHPFYPDQIYANANPFEPPATPPAAAGVPIAGVASGVDGGALRGVTPAPQPVVAAPVPAPAPVTPAATSTPPVW